jgi:hypothetical protein
LDDGNLSAGEEQLFVSYAYLNIEGGGGGEVKLFMGDELFCVSEVYFFLGELSLFECEL